MSAEQIGLSLLGKSLKFLWELVKPKFKLDVSGVFASIPDVGNKITIRNIGDKPIILMYWELVWMKKKNIFQSDRFDGESPEDFDDVRIDSFGSYTLYFQEADWFSTDHQFRKEQKLYINLWLAGEKHPIKRFVWKP